MELSDALAILSDKVHLDFYGAQQLDLIRNFDFDAQTVRHQESFELSRA